MPQYFIGVDVGSKSVRAGLVENGRVIKTQVRSITVFNPEPNHFEQSSQNIWEGIVYCVKKVVEDVDKADVLGIGFDATCSLVFLNDKNEPLSASTTGNSEQNIIMWMDHRAAEQAEFINSLDHPILKYVGGKASLEHEIPKILWIKQNLYEQTFTKIGKMFDLPDFLTWKCTGKFTRSICSTSCKWNYDAVKEEWNQEFLDQIGLIEIQNNNFEKIGNVMQFPGDGIEGGLSEKAAKDFGLLKGTPVGTSIIDAHAGALGMMGCSAKNSKDEITSKLVLIAGTSTCHMSVTKDPVWSKGVWGPYKHALLPNKYLNEAGQSATGLLLDHVVQTHPYYPKLLESFNGKNIYLHLNDLVDKQVKEKNIISFHELTKDFHLYPDFHGNRSPFSDSSLRGMMSGLTMGVNEESLLTVYLACVQALAYQTKQIITTLYDSGREPFKSILICGGLSKNSIFVQTHADILGIPVLLSSEPESVLLGAAMLGATAAKIYPDLEHTIKSMSNPAEVIKPDKICAEYHSKKYKVYLKMLENQRSFTKIMES